MKRKLTRMSLTELAKKMPVLSENQQMAYMGGLDDHDCWWRCIAYFKSGGTAYNEYDAMEIARDYYGENFDENNYEFTGKGNDLQNFVNSYFSGTENNLGSGKIIVFNPANVSGWVGEMTSYHAVVYMGYDNEGNFRYFDPQNDMSGVFDACTFSGYFVVNVN